MAAVIFFGAVSCAKEDISSSLAGGEVEVTFTANLPELGTRAYGDGLNANQLRCWVYDANGNTGDKHLFYKEVEQEVEGSRTFTFTLPLIKGMTYNFVLWADKDGLYNVNDEGIVTVDYTNANDNNRDAFYGFESFDPLKDTPKFFLRRPFAQINAATSEKMEDITANGLTLKSSSIKALAYTEFNIKACNVVGTSLEEVELAAEVMPYISGNELPGKETYTYLAMGYLLAPQDRMVSNVTFYFNGKKGGKDFTVGGDEGLSYTNVPLKQNYRTNILGALLTKQTEIEVEILPGFGEPNDNRVFNIIDLQAALDAAPENETTIINLGANIVGNVTDVQKPGRKVIIDGCGYKYNGSIKVHSNSNHYADAALTIKNLDFETSTASVNFIEALENGAQRYSCNITAEDCTFTATGDAKNTAVGVQIKASKNAKVIGCTATDVHSLIQAQSCDQEVLVQNCEVNGKNGVAFKQVKNAVVEGTTITATEYGIRFDGNTDKYGITVKNNNVTASQPFIVRKMTGKDNNIAVEGTNTLTVSSASISTEAPAYQIVITNGSDDEAYVKPTGTYTLTGADDYLVYPRDVYFLVATSAELVAALQTAVAAGETNIVFDANGANIGNFNKDDNTWFTTIKSDQVGLLEN